MVSVLAAHSVTHSFGKKEVLQDISFRCETGDVLGIFGRNGSGKSTLLKILFGLLNANSFDVTLNEIALNPSEVIKDQSIGYLPQHHFIPKWPRVRDIIPIYHQSEEKQELVFYDPGVAKIASKRIGELSLGELKYFECILIASKDHQFLLLDEPFSMLDPLQKEGLKFFLKKAQPKKGIIITDHYYADVLEMSTKNFVISAGRSTLISGEADLIQLNYLPNKS
ncbi:MAG: ABC-type multidrug transport system ATPase subunit [Candidatus Latescibacterota bacterium]|jgi:ABC-type multidrug transport system ATPase subunit